MKYNDSISLDRIKTLRKELQKLCLQHLEKCLEQGINLRVTEALRTIQYQNELYSKGRDANGKIIDKKLVVTYSKGGQSFHNYGAAYDVVILENNKAVWKSPLYKKIGEIGEGLGLIWGGRFGESKQGAGDGWDAPHFQLKGRLEDFKAKN